MKTKQRGDWQSMEDGKAKYAAYMCSREWGILKRAVHERSGGVCERCKLHPGDAVHHLNYERKYNELIEDLQHLCKACHDFTHAKSDIDPISVSPHAPQSDVEQWLNYLSVCQKYKNYPIPHHAMSAPDGIWQDALGPEIVAKCIAWRMLQRLIDTSSDLTADSAQCSCGLDTASLVPELLEGCLIKLESGIPFEYGLWKRRGQPLPRTAGDYGSTVKMYGFDIHAMMELWDSFATTD